MKNKKFIIIQYLCLFLLLTGCQIEKLQGKKEHLTSEELDNMYKGVWSPEVKRIANTAVNESYLSDMEKQVYYYLNLVRINPSLFAETYAKSYTGVNGYSKGYAFDERRESLIEELSRMEPLSIIKPNKDMYELAKCFAYEAGKKGVVGHSREGINCMGDYSAECISYGNYDNGLYVVMALLIDAGENNAALGHRRICLNNTDYELGVSVQPHSEYGLNTVLDFIRKEERIK